MTPQFVRDQRHTQISNQEITILKLKSIQISSSFDQQIPLHKILTFRVLIYNPKITLKFSPHFSLTGLGVDNSCENHSVVCKIKINNLHILTSGMEFEVLATKNPFFKHLRQEFHCQQTDQGTMDPFFSSTWHLEKNQLVLHLQPQGTQGW